MKKFAIYKLLAALLFTACVAQPGDGTDGNTHWVKCSDSNPCEQGSCVDSHCVDEQQQSELNTDDDAASAATHTPSNPIGGACIPGDEFNANFGGFSQDAVGVGRNSQCTSELCLVNHFQGRVTCAYGSTPDSTQDCVVPGSETPLTVPVQGQLLEHRSDAAVYCSCRCDGPDPEAEYCNCGEGFTCADVIEFAMPGDEDTLGSYCVKQGPEQDPDTSLQDTCRREDESCGAVGSDSPDALGVSIDAEGVPELTTQSYSTRLVEGNAELCLHSTLPVSTRDGAPQASCAMFEGIAEGDDDACTGLGRRPAPEQWATVARQELLRTAGCSSDEECEQMAICEVVQLTDAMDSEQYTSCLNDENAEGNGWCYIDPANDLGDSALVEQCEGEGKHRIRFVGAGTPVPEAPLVLACSGKLNAP